MASAEERFVESRMLHLWYWMYLLRQHLAKKFYEDPRDPWWPSVDRYIEEELPYTYA